jgi:acyl-CoA reductase-like NAD-dependent aldehyde dehydrogenase
MDAYKLFIDGGFVDAQSGETFESLDPGTGAVIARVARAGTADAEAAIAAARSAFDHGSGAAWRRRCERASAMTLPTRSRPRASDWP